MIYGEEYIISTVAPGIIRVPLARVVSALPNKTGGLPLAASLAEQITLQKSLNKAVGLIQAPQQVTLGTKIIRAGGKINLSQAESVTLTENHAVPIATFTLNTDTNAANFSERTIITPSPSGTYTHVRVTFRSANAGGNLVVNHASIGIQNTTYNTVATPVELLFGGASGFTIGSAASKTSDWLAFSIAAGNVLVVIQDFGSPANFRFSTSGGNRYYLASTASYNVAAPAGSWTNDSDSACVLQVDAF